jgi:hypothetical protein
MGIKMEIDIEIKLKYVHEELPEKSGEYLCIAGYYADENASWKTEWIVLHYSAKHKLFNVRDEHPAKYAEKHAIPAVWWAELPYYSLGRTTEL